MRSVTKQVSNKYRLTTFLLLIPAAVLLGSGAIQSQESDFCFECHSDEDLTGERAGKEISVFVDQSAFESSLHGELE